MLALPELLEQTAIGEIKVMVLSHSDRRLIRLEVVVLCLSPEDNKKR